MEILDKVLAGISELSMSAAIGMVAMGVELVLRLIKSSKPLSVLHLVGLGIKKVGAICLAAGDLLDKVLPQRLK